MSEETITLPTLEPGPTEIRDEEAAFIPTHLIGDVPVVQHRYATGLPYYLDESGKKRMPDKERRPLRPFKIAPDPARTLYLDREAFCLCMSALLSPDQRAETGFSIAEVIDPEHVSLFLCERGANGKRFTVQIPEQFAVIGCAEE